MTRDEAHYLITFMQNTLPAFQNVLSQLRSVLESKFPLVENSRVSWADFEAATSSERSKQLRTLSKMLRDSSITWAKSPIPLDTYQRSRVILEPGEDEDYHHWAFDVDCGFPDDVVDRVANLALSHPETLHGS